MILTSRETGAGEPIVILHGLFGSARNWQSIAQKLSISNHVFTIDLPNHGSSGWTNCMSYGNLSRIISKFIVENNIEGATVLGHSLGGKLAMVIALTKPALVGRLIVADIAPVKYDHDNLSVVKALECVDLSLVKTRGDADWYLKKNIRQQAMRSFLLQNLVSDGDRYKWRINITAIKANLHKIQGFPSFTDDTFYNGPTLFVAAANSEFIHPTHDYKIKRFFPNSSLVKIANAGHWIHADNPEAFLSSITGFIRS